MADSHLPGSGPGPGTMGLYIMPFLYTLHRDRERDRDQWFAYPFSRSQSWFCSRPHAVCMSHSSESSHRVKAQVKAQGTKKTISVFSWCE